MGLFLRREGLFFFFFFRPGWSGRPSVVVLPECAPAGARLLADESSSVDLDHDADWKLASISMVLLNDAFLGETNAIDITRIL